MSDFKKRLFYSSFLKFDKPFFLNKRNRIKILIILLLSFFVKVLYFIYNKGVIGSDANEYLEAAKKFENQPLNYIFNNSPYTFWRLPLFPLILFITKSLYALYIIQLILSYYAAYLIFKIFIKFKFSFENSCYTCLFSLFVPYFNIAAMSPGVEFLQVLMLLYITKKIIYDQNDAFLICYLVLLCFLRPESFIIVIFILIRNIYLKHFKPALYTTVPLILLLVWMTRNLFIFGSFSMINPIMSSRAMIGSIYGVIYVEKPHPFHKKYNYYDGFDYVNKKEFVKKYKSVARQELSQYILHHPVQYVQHRIINILKCFSYISLHGEHMPDKDWKIYSTDNRVFIIKNNSIWGYSNLISNKDYFRLSLRLLYNFTLVIGHFAGLIYILINCKRFKMILFVFLTFSYLFIVESDMRYFIFVQLICICFAFVWLLQIGQPSVSRIKKYE